MNPHQSRNSVKFMNDENGQQEMIASDYYAQQLAMQMTNPLYSYGGFGQSQLYAASQDYQFQSPEMEHFNSAQLQGYLQSFGNYGQYSPQGMQIGSYSQSDGSGFGQFSQYQYMAGGGGKCTDCHSSCPAEEGAGMRADSGNLVLMSRPVAPRRATVAAVRDLPARRMVQGPAAPTPAAPTLAARAARMSVSSRGPVRKVIVVLICPNPWAACLSVELAAVSVRQCKADSPLSMLI